MADGDFSALIQAKLQTDELEAKLKEIQNRKIELNIDVSSNGKDAAQKLADSINKGLKSTKLESVDLTKQITEAFNISDKGVTKQIKAQIEQIMSMMASTWNGQTFKLGDLGGQFDTAFDQLANTITENANIIQSSMGIYDEFFNYFKNKKIYISDDLKNAFNVDEYKDLLRNNIGSIVRDATKGISIDSLWGEMVELFPEHFSADVTNQVDQIVQAFNLLKQARADVTKSISAKDLSAEDYLGITNDAYSKVGEIASQIGESLQASIQAASASAQNTVEINVQVNTDKIISDIQTAIKNATSSLGNAIEVKLNINEAELATAVQNALANVTAGGAPVSIAVTVDQQTLQDDLNAALSNLNLPIHFTVDAAQLESEIRAALNNITDISVDLHVNTDSLTDASNGVYNYLDMFEVDTVNADALLSGLNDINAAGQRGDSIFQSFSGTLREVFGMYTAARLLRDAVYKVINAGKEAVQTVVDIDSSMTQLQIVTGATSSEMTEFLETSISLAKELGQSVTDIVDSMTVFSRLGYSLEESSQLASYAAILSNTADVSTDDSTTGLTAILKGYSLSVDQAESIASSLIAVGNNYAISASELIEAYEKAGAALSASGTSFEESAGLFAAANAANQSASSIGTALKTVSARIRSSTTAGQQELEELGEDVTEFTELSNGFSTYASELESLTGFSILEEGTTDTYKNIYEIFEGISEVWDKLSDTAQARVSTILGGTRQYSVIASLLANFGDAAGAYEDALNSAGTAAEANQEYMQSLQARIEKLSAALQSLANDTISSELYGQLIDCGTAIVEFADNTQILQAALAGIGSAGAVAVFEKMASSVREVVTGFSNFSTALNMVQTGNITGQFDQLLQLTNGLSTSQTKLILSSTSLSDAQRVAILMGQGMSEAEAQATLSTMGLATAQGGATTTTVTFSSALKGLWSTLLANPLVLVAAGVTAAVAGFSAYNRSVKEARENATDAAEAWGESNDSLATYRDRILELREALDSGTLSEEDAYEAKTELLSIQQSLSESYGEQVEGLSLVNGELQTQLDLIDQLSTADAKTYLKDNADQIKKATNKIEGFEFSLGTYYSDTEIGDALEGIISQYSDYFRKESTWDGGIELYFDANAEDAETVLSDFKLQILDLQESTGNDSFLNTFYKGANNAITQASSVLEKWQEIYDEAQEAQIIADTQTFSYGGTEQTAAKWLNDYAKAVEAYNEALALGDTEEIETAKAAYDSLAEAMDYLVQNTDMSDYADNVDEISGELDTASVAANNLKDALQGINIDDDLESVVKTYADRLTDAGLTDIDFQLVLENPEEYDAALADAVTGLQWYATQAGISVEDLITMLTDLGIISTQVSEDVDEAAESAVQLTENQLANLKNTFHETREYDEISQWFNTLSDTDKSIVYQVALNYDISDLQTVQDWIDALANETSLQSFYDLLEDEEDDNFSDALAEYTNDLQTLQEAYENLLSGDLSDSDIVELEAEFGELVGHTDDTEDLADAIQKLMNKIIGLSDDTADSDTVMGLFNDTLEELGGESTAAGQALLLYRDDLLALFTVAEENPFDSVVESSQNAIDSISAVVDALNAQTTGTSVDYESFTSDELADYQSALEYVNGSLQLNKTKVQEITEAKVAETKATNEATKAQKQADYAANAKEIKQLTESLSECDETSDEYADTLAQIQKLQSDNSAITAECTQLDLLNASLDESISKYQKWKDALNASESGDMFDDMQEMMQAIKDVNDVDSEDYGKVGTQKYQAAVDFIVPDTVDSADQEAVYSYLKEIEKYMTFDDDGDYTGLNLSQFINDAVDQGLMYLDEDSQSYKIAGEQTMQAFADGMGLSLETVQAIFGELEEYLPEGSEFVWSDGSKSLEDMAIAANEAATALQQIDSTKELDIVTDVSGIEDTETKISTLENTIQQMESLKAQPDIDTTQIDNANAVIEYCQTQIDALNGTDTNVDVTADTTDADTGISDVNNTEIEDKTTTITADDKASPVIQSIKALLSTLRDKVVTITTNHVTTTSTASGTGSVTGTAYASGTAKTSGDWGTKKSGRTLVGELGREIVVNPYTGRWYTVGDNGAEFADIPKGSIVFNHKQSEDLLSEGNVASRGLALAGGTALASGTSTVSQGGIKVSTVTNQKTTTTTTTSTSSGSSSKSSSSSSSTSSSTGTDEFEESFDWIEIAIDRIERAISSLDLKVSSVYKTWSTRNTALKDEINKVSEEIETQQAAYQRYIKEANSVGLSSKYKKMVQNGTIDISTITDEDLYDKIQEYQELYEKALSCKDAMEELSETQSELYETAFNNVISQYEAILQVVEYNQNMIDEFITQQETSGYLVSTKYYEALEAQELKNIAQMQAEKEELLAALNEMVANDATAVESEDWYSLTAQIDDVTYALEQSETALMEYENQIRELEWQSFDLLQEQISQITDEADYLIDLLSNDVLYEDNGQLTDEGLATMGLHAVNYDTYLAQAQDYADEIAEIDKELADDPYNQDLIDRREELLELQQEMIIAAEDERDAIVDMVESGIEKELDSLQALIDTYTDALDSAKSLYDYQQSVADKTSTISTLEKQLSAYENDTSEESRSRIQQIKVDLESAREDLESTEYDRYISDQKELLSNLFDEAESVLNARLDDVDALLADMITQINDSSSTINETLTSAAESVGYTLTDSMTTIWGETNVSGVVTSVNSQIQTSATSINTALSAIKSAIESAEEQSDTQAETETTNLTTANSDTASSTLSDSAQGTAGTTTSTTAAETKTTTSSSASKSTSTQGDGKLQVGDQVTYKSGKYYYDSYGSSPTGTKNKGKKVYVTKIVSNPKSGQNYPIALSTGKKLGDGDLGWVKKSQITGYASGVKEADKDEWAWTQEEGTEILRRAADGAMLTPIGNGDTVFNADATQNLWKIANNPSKFIQNGMEQLIKDSVGSVENATGSSFSASIGDISFDFTLPNVANYDDFKYALQHDKNIEHMIQDMTIGQLFGGSQLKKYKY
ncbi:MAG: phage tail tape measure protein [Clostridiales bacterium]|nr:phage tail tape measure protein [Clostridiales bacterium]